MLNRSLTLKTLALSAVLTAGLFSASSAFAKKNGSGYGGPDLSPTTVPAASDIGYTMTEVTDAFNRCMVTGTDMMPGVLPQFLSSLYGKNVEGRLNSSEVPRSTDHPEGKAWRLDFWLKCDMEKSKTSDSFVVSCDNETLDSRRNPGSLLQFGLLPEGEIPLIGLTTGLPSLGFERAALESTYNDWGIKTFYGYRLFRPKILQYWAAGEIVSQGKVKDLRFPYELIVSCLQSELQKAAR